MKLYIPENVFENDMEFNYSYHRNLDDFIGIHGHDFHELFIIFSGELIHVLNGNKNLLTAGTLVMIHPDDIHRYEKSNNSECEYINLAFTKDTFTKYAILIGIPNQIDALLNAGNYQTVIESDFLKQIKLKCKNISSKKYISYEVKSLFFTIIAHLIASLETDNLMNVPNEIQKICSDLQNPENFDKRLNTIFSAYKRSYEHCCRSFTKNMGETPTAFFNKIKMNYAKNLLVLTNYPILDISLHCGFENVGHFYKLFEKYHKTTPAKYRKQHKQRFI